MFITGTGTDVGKTYIAAQLIRYIRLRGQTVRAVKPVVTGYTAETADASDPATLLDALGEPVSGETLEAISPWRYAAALAPESAAALEGKRVDFEAISAFTVQALRTSPADYTIVEGLGGVMVPFDAENTLLDLLSVAAVPAVVVAGTYLGTLSHTLTALSALRARGVPVTSVVSNESSSSTVTPEQTVAALSPFVTRLGSSLVCLRRNPTPGEIEKMCAAILHRLHT